MPASDEPGTAGNSLDSIGSGYFSDGQGERNPRPSLPVLGAFCYQGTLPGSSGMPSASPFEVKEASSLPNSLPLCQ